MEIDSELRQLKLRQLKLQDTANNSTNNSKVIPVNQKVKDSLFKTIYQKEERLTSLAQFLLKLDIKGIDITTVKPVIYGNKENDLSFMCNHIIYIMVEAQSSPCTNIPFRVLGYSSTGLRELITSEKLLYGSKRVYIPIPKFFAMRVGLENNPDNIPDEILTDYNLSDSYWKDISGSNIKPDLELTVHVFDLRMSSYEICRYIEENYVPERFVKLDDSVLKYALTSNSLKYMMMLERGHKTLKKPDNIQCVEDLCELLKARNIFVEIFSDKEARNMIAAQFSREDMIRYAGWEEGMEEGLEQGLRNIVCNMYTKNYTIEQISSIAEISEERVKEILNLR